jgi:hypothetical protein
MYVFIALVLADAVAAAYLVVNAWVRPSTDFAGVPEGRWSYIVIQGAYVVVYAIAQVPALVRLMPWAHAYPLAAPFVLIGQLAYLLRVVYPTHGRLEARLEAQCTAVAAAAALLIDPDADPTIARSTTHA